MIERIAYRKGFLGDALADGGIPASKKIGKKSFDYLIQDYYVESMIAFHWTTSFRITMLKTQVRTNDYEYGRDKDIRNKNNSKKIKKRIFKHD